MAGYKWQPLRRSEYFIRNPKIIEQALKDYPHLKTKEEAEAFLDEYTAGCEYFVNDLYQVEKRPDPAQIDPPFVYLNIRRRDGAAIFDWRHMQQIKNELVGKECEAVQLFPADSRLVDTSNKYHLWVCTSPQFRFPFGFTYRDVSYDERSDVPGMRQRGQSLR